MKRNANTIHRIEPHIKQRYNIEIDRSGKDISRACFLPHDQNVFINTKYF
ncbi:MAG: hypothetical protein MJ000_08500 [Bacteroidales bacterium]|nr:hypothetical protein [Bacteroidales bacterium]